MRAEKQIISNEYVKRLNASPFFIVVDYRGLKVGPINELRKRLGKAGAEMHVVKNSLFRLAVKEAGVVDLGAALAGQLAVVTGPKDVSAAAKVVKTFRRGIRQAQNQVWLFEEPAPGKPPTFWPWPICPPLKSCGAGCLGFWRGRPPNWSTLLNTPATQLARVLKGRQEKLGAPAAA